MLIQKLYSDLQVNPRSIATYRELAKFYENIGKINENKAFLELIKKKFHDNNSDIDQK